MQPESGPWWEWPRERAYSPDQPRWEKGNPEGGQWRPAKLADIPTAPAKAKKPRAPRAKKAAPKAAPAPPVATPVIDPNPDVTDLSPVYAHTLREGPTGHREVEASEIYARLPEPVRERLAEFENPKQYAAKKEAARTVRPDGSMPIEYKQGAKKSVGFTYDEVAQFPGAIMTHNHPSGSGLSPPDVSIAADYRLLEIRAFGTGPDGGQRYFSLRPQEGHEWPTASTFSKRWREIYKEVLGVQQRLVGMGRMTPEQAQLMHHRHIASRAAMEFGLVYEEGTNHGSHWTVDEWRGSHVRERRAPAPLKAPPWDVVIQAARRELLPGENPDGSWTLDGDEWEPNYDDVETPPAPVAPSFPPTFPRFPRESAAIPWWELERAFNPYHIEHGEHGGEFTSKESGLQPKRAGETIVGHGLDEIFWPLKVGNSVDETLLNFEVAERRRSPVEEAAVIAPDGSVLLTKAGDEHHVPFTVEERDAMRGRDVTFSHNHPNGSPLSASDLAFAAAIDAREMRAIGIRNGNEHWTFTATRPEKGWPDWKQLAARYEELDANPDISTNKVLRQLASEYGFKYRALLEYIREREDEYPRVAAARARERDFTDEEIKHLEHYVGLQPDGTWLLDGGAARPKASIPWWERERGYNPHHVKHGEHGGEFTSADGEPGAHEHAPKKKISERKAKDDKEWEELKKLRPHEASVPPEQRALPGMGEQMGEDPTSPLSTKLTGEEYNRRREEERALTGWSDPERLDAWKAYDDAVHEAVPGEFPQHPSESADEYDDRKLREKWRELNDRLPEHAEEMGSPTGWETTESDYGNEFVDQNKLNAWKEYDDQFTEGEREAGESESMWADRQMREQFREQNKASEEADLEAEQEAGAESEGVGLDIPAHVAAGAEEAAKHLDLDETPTGQERVEAKQEIQQTVGSRIAADQSVTTDQLQAFNSSNEFHGASTISDKATTPRDQESELAAANLVNLWANTSGDSATNAIAAQLVAKDVFHLENASTDHLGSYGEGVGKARELANRHAAAIGATQLAIYANTQESLKDAPDMIWLYRGVAEDVPDGSKIKLQPLSSFSTNAETSASSDFTGGGSGSVFAIQVPKSAIFSTARTGYGCLNEYEVVVLGGEYTVVRVSTGYGY